MKTESGDFRVTGDLLAAALKLQDRSSPETVSAKGEMLLFYDANANKVMCSKNGAAAVEVALVAITGERVDATGNVFLSAIAAAPSSGHLAASEVSFSLDEVGNTVVVTAKYSDGTTVKSATIALT